ncbi:hypothetical protein Tco_0605773 [Tanacetum coccineum]
MEPTDTLLMRDKVINTTYARENDKFIKSSVDDFVPIPREFEVTSVNIDLPLGEPLNTLLTEDRDIEEIERLLADDHVPIPRVFNDPLGNSDSMSRSSDTSDLFEELTAEISLDNSIQTKIDD